MKIKAFVEDSTSMAKAAKQRAAQPRRVSATAKSTAESREARGF
jgi:hypothetical protein